VLAWTGEGMWSDEAIDGHGRGWGV